MADTDQKPASPPKKSAAPSSRDQLREMLFQPGAEPGVAQAAVDDLVTSLMGPTARVTLPREEDMVLKLVSIQSLERLDDARKTAASYWTVATTAIGSTIGFVTNVVTSDAKINSHGKAFLGLLIVVALVFVGLGILASRHEARLRGDLNG